jgi:hypothetical protein
MKLRMKKWRNLITGPLPSVAVLHPGLRPFRQRLFLAAIGGYAALNLVVGFLRNQLLLEQIFLRTKGTSIEDALSIVGTDAG